MTDRDPRPGFVRPGRWSPERIPAGFVLVRAMRPGRR